MNLETENANVDQDLYEARKMVMTLRDQLARSKAHSERCQKKSHEYKLKYKSEVTSWKTLATHGGQLLREVLATGKVSAMFRHRVQQHLVVLPHERHDGDVEG